MAKQSVVLWRLSLNVSVEYGGLALFSGQLAKLPKSGEWMNWVRRLTGWVLVGMAAYFVRSILPLALQQYILAVVAIAAGVHSTGIVIQTGFWLIPRRKRSR